MQVIRNKAGDHSVERGVRSVVTIGNFDGVHPGHQALLRRCRELAGDRQSVSVSVVTFEPLPQTFFRPQHAQPRLSTVYQKLERFELEGVDQVWLLRFDSALSHLSAEHFVKQVLVDGLAAIDVVVGQDFRFGHGREGNVDLLRKLGETYDFRVEVVPAVFMGEERISSTAIRQALAAGHYDRAAALLGRPFLMEGHVVLGKQLGRTLGYPTANLRIRVRPSPLQGIFAVYARSLDPRAVKMGLDSWKPGVSSIGIRPTVGGTEPLLEVHFFDFDGDLYGHHLEVEFVAKLRDEARFESLDDLVTQMRLDDAGARKILSTSEQSG